IAVSSVRSTYCCNDCGKTSQQSQSLEAAKWPLHFAEHVCSTCGGTTRNEMPAEMLTPLKKASTSVPPASAKLIAQRDEILSRALTDANVAQAGDGATAAIGADDTILGKYKIVKRLSAGGMAEVFLAKQVGIGGFEKPVALKRIQRQLLETRHLAIDMFLNEAKIAGRLMHPNIVQVLDVGEVGGALYLAMEYVNGKDLRDIVKKLRTTRAMMPLGEVCFVVREVAKALHHAYWSMDMAGKRLSVVHRDVSPHNIILSFDGTVKLLDFGVAMSSVTEHDETMVVGKWLYMSPEHTTKQAVDHRSDLFSLGVILYLLCTGNMPFSGTDPKEIVRKIRAGQYKRLQEAAPDLPESLATLIDRLLAPKPEDRPQTGNEVVAALTEFTRSYGFDSSNANVAYFLSQLFASELVGTDAAGMGEARPDLATEVAMGSGATQPQGEAGSQSQPGSLTPNSLTPGSLARRSSGVVRNTPQTGLSAVDVSVSLARRSGEYSVPNNRQDASGATIRHMATPPPKPPLPPANPNLSNPNIPNVPNVPNVLPPPPMVVVPEGNKSNMGKIGLLVALLAVVIIVVLLVVR
ncbi:MAG: serine/threonine-protein kinase, partial [Proteobacteria bacterium]|nr:serine/threonine-protein kinase [Pseudomonadota bacterium]